MSELCGFITILSGTFLLHGTREPNPPVNPGNTSSTEMYCKNLDDIILLQNYALFSTYLDFGKGQQL